MIRLLIVCLFAVFFSSCLDSHEELWLNEDASGKARIQISLPLNALRLHGGEQGARSMIKHYFESAPAFSSYSVDTNVHGDQLKIDISMAFDDVFNLESTISSAAGDMLGTSEVEAQGLDLRFHRRIDLTKAFPGAMFIPRDQLKGHKLTTILHLPEVATPHNAHNTENSGKTLIWSTSLTSALHEPIHQAFTLKLPIPWLTIGSIALPMVVGISAVFYYVYRRKKNMRRPA